MPTHDSDAKVLIVDSTDPLREALRQNLQETGITVFEAGSAAAALELVSAQSPKVLVVDLELPTMHGLELCRRLRADGAETPIIVVSAGNTDWRMRQDLKETFGIRHVFGRPADLIKLTQTVRLVLEGQDVNTDPPALRAEAEARWNAGMTAFERGDLEAAIAELEAGVRIEREAFELQYHLALLYGQREDLFAAMAALEVAVSLQPMHFSALKNLAVIYQRAGFRHQALDVWERVLEAAPDQETRAHIRDHMVALLA
jgi:DNA-binding response OmpR family regulator